MLSMTVIRFNELTRGVDFKGPRTSVGGKTKESSAGLLQRLRVWNHFVLIHLQYGGLCGTELIVVIVSAREDLALLNQR
jgi:hypothetical protein